MMHLRNRFLAGALAVMMAVSSMQFPVRNVRAEEAVETKETETGVEGTGNKEEDFDSSASVGESVEKETETAIESIETVETTEISEVGTVADHTEGVETTTESIETVETTEIEETVIEPTEETGTWETELESEEQKETLVTEESTLESEEETETETETEQISKASEDDIASGTSRNITWVIDVNGNLTVKGTGDFAHSDEVLKRAPWYNYRSYIKSVKINLNDMTDASYMFYGCSKLTQIDLSGMDTSSVINMGSMFNGCSGLTEINLNGLNTSNVTNMAYMFSGCSGLTEINLSGLNTSSVRSMFSMFRDCSGLTGINLNGIDTSSVIDMSRMFRGCSGLTEIDMSGMDTSNVTNMDEMFYGCSILSELNMNGLDAQSVRSMKDIFQGCSYVNKIYTFCYLWQEVELPINTGDIWKDSDGQIVTTLPTGLKDSILLTREEKRSGSYGNVIWTIDDNRKLTVKGTGEYSDNENRTPWKGRYIKSAEINVTGMTDASYMFNGCNTLNKVDFSGSDTSSVTNMSSMFSGCSGLTEIDMSEMDTSSVTNMSSMFSGCSGLTEIDMSGMDTSSVTNMSEMFSGCSGLTKIDMSGMDTSSVTNMAGVFYGCSGLTEIDMSRMDTSSVTSMGGVFCGCSGLTKIDMSGIDTSSVTNMNSMFRGCSELTEINLSGIDTSNVTGMDSMFGDCSELTEIDISGIDTSSAISMDSMFRGCSELTNLDLSCFDTSKVTNMRAMFENCSSLKNLNISSFDTSSVVDTIEYETMIRMFYGCSSLTSLDLSGFDISRIINLSEMFYGCSSLTSLDLSGFDTSNVRNMYSMFYGCSNLTSLDLSGFDTSKVSDMGYMFSGCSSLTSIDVSSFDTSKVVAYEDSGGGYEIMKGMFSGCSSLISIDVSNFNISGVWSLGEMFRGCSSLTSVDMSKWDTSNLRSMYEMFRGCSSLTSVDMSNFDLGSIESIGAIQSIFEESNQLTTLYTPYNLPRDTSFGLSGNWYKVDGTKFYQLPQNQDYSILIMKDQIPNKPSPCIKAIKEKTVYECGDILYTGDLTVRCYDTEGTVRRVTDYTTNVNQIDMSTSGIKSLVITYRGYTTEVPITVKGNETPVKISGLIISDSIYTSEPFACTGTAVVTTDTGEDVTADVPLTYTYKGTMADGKPYEISNTAPVNAGNYNLTVAVDKSNRKYSGSAEYTFKITKAPIQIIASDVTLTVGSSLPETYKYEVKGLLNEDKLVKEPSFICNADMTKAGIYGIVPYGANAGMNYEITNINGTLIVNKKEVEKEAVTISGISISNTAYTGKTIAYNGKASVKQEDGTDITYNVPLVYTYSGKQADGNEYAPTETAPVNAGTYTLTVAVPQENEYYVGSIAYPFEITQAPITITALDKTFQAGENIELPAAYPYEVAGLLNDDKLTAEPSFIYTDANGKEIAREDIDFKKAGQYEVLPKEADAGMNYTIHYQKGILAIKKTSETLPDDNDDNDNNSDQNEVLPDDVPESGIPENNTIWASSVPDQVYTGVAVKPAVRVYFGKKRLTEKTDYTISYKNNKQLGKADLIITGKGNYTDKKTLHFNIMPKDITDEDIIIEDMAYAENGKQHKTAPNVVYNGKKLKAGRDFDITYGEGDYTAAGEYYAVITGKGNFTGTYDRVKTTVIDKNMLLNKAKIAKIPNQEYRKGQEIILADSMVKVTLNGTMLVKDTDYTVDYVNNQNVGKASVVIRGKGKYAGTKTASFKIVRTPVHLGEVSFTCDFAKETIFRKGGCMPVPKVSYDGETLRNGTDYTVTYKNNKKCGTAFLTVKGKGNYKGSRTFEFTIKPKELSAVAVRAADIAYVNKANKYQSKPVLTDTDGIVLKAGTDYKITGYEYDGKILGRQDCPPENAKITVTVEGKGSYQGVNTISYELRTGTSFKKAKITIADQTFTGVSIKPAENAITEASVKKNDTVENLVYGRDYEIVAYGSNDKKGSGTIVLRGLGNYYGEKTVKFKIVGKSVE